ncbi:hypothetical protein HELRODRAFT_182098 [Helobdella robusta]|uniref:Endonuclease/exonuclease/phosphatase domain-containing protein n=1 Tax=Helobdella robusta TaxID=6412 RepID=T1FHQ9_HELRO|nr:hypothetical protein HELRODRAFT_182098 [Helobdella robusta]ESN91242.1 hypothetical protein HELRODRAFT_182098 [Helobdella robusta]
MTEVTITFSIRQKRVQRILGDSVHGNAVQGLATGTPLYSVAVQGTMVGRITCRPRSWRFGTWNVGTLTGRSLKVVEELQEEWLTWLHYRRSDGRERVQSLWGLKAEGISCGTGGVGVMVRKEKEEEKDRFYDDVSDEIGQAGLDEFVVLLSDLNDHVWADEDGYESVHGGWGYGIRNEEELRVLELVDAIAWWWGLSGLQGNQHD